MLLPDERKPGSYNRIFFPNFRTTRPIMAIRPLFILFLIGFYTCAAAQSPVPFSCGQKEYITRLLRNDTTLLSARANAETQLTGWKRKAQALAGARAMGTPVVLPVVVHIIHNNGPENISDAQV